MSQPLESLTITPLLEMARIYGYNVRFFNKRGDLAWAPIKNLLLKIDNKLKFTQWNQTCEQFYPFMKNKLHLYGDTIIDPDTNLEKNDHLDRTIWEPHHFFLQHGRIVKMFEPSLMRLYQISYNTGQLLAQLNIDQSHYTPIQKEYLSQKYNNIQIYDMHSYITDSDIDNLNIRIKDEENTKILLKVFHLMCQIDTIPTK